MKHFTSTLSALLACGMLTLGSTSADAQNNAMAKAKPVTENILPMKMPQVIRSYIFDPFMNDWFLETVDSVRYNKQLMPLTKRTDFYADVDYVEYSTMLNYQYNEDGMVTEEIEEATFDMGESWDKSYRTAYGYDTEAKYTAISKEMFAWDPEACEWIYDDYADGTFFMDIVRDADRRITETTQYVNGSKADALAKRTFEYAEDGNLMLMNWELPDEAGTLVPSYLHRDMYWVKTNGQFVHPTTDVYEPFGDDPENILENYLLCNVNADGTEGEMAAAWSTTFDEKMRYSYVRIKKQDGGSIGISYQYDLDENGSYDITKMTRTPSESGDTRNIERTLYTLDANGNMAGEEVFAVNPDTGNEELIVGTKYENTYDEEGNLTSVVISINEGGGYELYDKKEYAEYIDGTTTGIGSISAGRPQISFINGSVSVANANGAIYVITDMDGKTVRRGIVNGDITTEGLPHGMYIVNINGSNARTAVKLISK